jgi:hypothetical protein
VADEEDPTDESVEDKLVDEVVERLMDRVDGSSSGAGGGRILQFRDPVPWLKPRPVTRRVGARAG